MINLDNFDTISFSLDGVLFDEFDGTINPLKGKMMEICQTMSKAGKRILIYTRRYYQTDSRHISDDNKKEYKEAYDMLKGINFSDIIFTDRNSYYGYFNNDHRQCHFECSEYEEVLLKRYKQNTTVININNPDWINKIS